MITCIKDLNQIITLSPAQLKGGRFLKPKDLGVIEKASVIFNEEKILWIGPQSEEPSSFSIDKVIDGSNKVLTPALIDSHTHLVFGGDRSFEYTLKLNGADYEEIATKGGGILNTVESTLKESYDELFAKSVKRVENIYAYGVKTIEIKSGYALTYDGEVKLTKVISKLKKHFKGRVNIVNTFMAAHAIPKEFTSSMNYIDEVVLPLLNDLSEEIDIVDIFFEKGYFDKEDTIKLFNEAKKLNIATKIHADEFNDNKGAILACEYRSLSADHLLCTTDDGITALAKSSTVATFLPGTALFLGKSLVNARSFLDQGVKVALASDYNPGSCHCDNVLLIASITAKNLGLNICELWSSITLNAASALGLKNEGFIEVGATPNFTLFDVSSIDHITYNWGKNFNLEF